MLAALAIAGACSLAAAGLEAEAGLELDGSARRMDAPAVPARAASELALSPRLSLAARADAFDARLAYLPRLRAPELSRGDRIERFHALDLRLEVRAPAATVAMAGFGAWTGETDLLAEARRTGAAPLTLPGRRFLLSEGLRGRVEGTRALSRHTSLRSVLEASVGGGSRPGDRAVLPWERAWRVAAGTEHVLSRRDRLGVGLDATLRALASGPRGAVAALEAGWRRKLTHSTEALLQAGGGAAWNDLPGKASSFSLYPAGGGGLAIASGPLDASAAARLGAAVDRITGRADPQADASGEVHWSAGRGLTLRARGAGALARHPGGATRRVFAELGVSFRLSAELRAYAGPYAIWQRAPAAAGAAFDEVGFAVTLAVAGRPARVTEAGP